MSTYEVTHPTLPPTIGDDTPRARRNDPETSHAAADSNSNRHAVEAHVLTLFEKYGTLTDHELTERYFADPNAPKAHQDSPRKRRSDLTDKGVIVAFRDDTRLSPSGRRMQVYGLTVEVNR
jgi:hypothetical protein